MSALERTLGSMASMNSKQSLGSLSGADPIATPGESFKPKNILVSEAEKLLCALLFLTSLP